MAPPTSIRAYRPELRQPEHAHSKPHLSLVLAGRLTEGSAGEERRIGPGMCVLRQAGFGHQVLFGRDGALIVSMSVPEAPELNAGGWVRAPETLVRTVFASAVGRESGLSLEDAMWDALAGVLEPRQRKAPPPWLLQARDRLVEESVSIATLAADAGVHRVHFSRSFGEAFGTSPTLYRRHVRTLRATAGALSGIAAAESAYVCGFADQSHMARSIRHATGMSYGGLSRLRPRVTSVQD